MHTKRVILYVAGAVLGLTCLFRLNELLAHLPMVLGTIAFLLAAGWYLTKTKVIDISRFMRGE